MGTVFPFLVGPKYRSPLQPRQWTRIIICGLCSFDGVFKFRKHFMIFCGNILSKKNCFTNSDLKNTLKKLQAIWKLVVVASCQDGIVLLNSNFLCAFQDLDEFPNIRLLLSWLKIAEQNIFSFVSQSLRLAWHERYFVMHRTLQCFTVFEVPRTFSIPINF